MADAPEAGLIPLLVRVAPGVTPDQFEIVTESCTLGRAASCDVVVNGPQISRLHATIARSGPRYLLTDAGSRNGTFVNGSRIERPHLLSDDDLIGLGAPTPLLRFVDPDTTSLSSTPQPAMPSTARLHYDPQTMLFTLDGQRLELTLMQLRLLTHLYKHAGTLCTRESCAEAIWGRNYEPGIDAGALDQAMNSLRRALSQAAPGTRLIQTRRGLGYVLTPGDEE